MANYDNVPYPSYCYVNTDPGRMSAIGALFGIDAPAIETANILEIGCAAGGNILPLAARYPNAKFTGVDLSQNQIDTARGKADSLQLSNIKFEAISIAAHKFGSEKFDYIIAHGIYSWVASDIQAAILSVCQNHLSDTGLAYISYNTLPGWNSVKTVRDMMLYHVAKFEDPAMKTKEARGILTFISENVKSQDSPHKAMLLKEIKNLQNADDAYLLHDHLEDINEPCYFHQFMEKATSHDLAYLGDSEPQSMYLGNQTEEASKALSQLNDVVSQEQYMDFITDRRFRSTLLCKNTVTLNRKLTPQVLDGLHLIPNFTVDTSAEVKPSSPLSELPLVHMKDGKAKVHLRGQVICAGYVKLLQSLPQRLTVDEVVTHLEEALPQTSKEDIQAEFSGMVLKLIFGGVLSVSTTPAACAYKITSKPEAFKVARTEAHSKELVPNLLHDVVKLTNDQRLVIQYVTGENTQADIAKKLNHHIAKGDLKLSADGKPMTVDSDALTQHLPEYVTAQLAFFGNNALLVN
ncbi:MAG: class I SAM-dependent methyltransferase [Sneathiella sp.]